MIIIIIINNHLVMVSSACEASSRLVTLGLNYLTVFVIIVFATTLSVSVS